MADSELLVALAKYLPSLPQLFAAARAALGWDGMLIFCTTFTIV
jgi:hypothetical protein